MRISHRLEYGAIAPAGHAGLPRAWRQVGWLLSQWLGAAVASAMLLWLMMLAFYGVYGRLGHTLPGSVWEAKDAFHVTFGWIGLPSGLVASLATGWLQGRVLRPFLPALVRERWLTRTAVAVLAGFALAAAVVALAGFHYQPRGPLATAAAALRIDAPFLSLLVTWLGVGLAMGVAQARLWRRAGQSAGRSRVWSTACVTASGLAATAGGAAAVAVMAPVMDSPVPLPAASQVLLDELAWLTATLGSGAVTAGLLTGLVYGLVTGPVLLWLLHTPPGTAGEGGVPNE